MLSSNLILKFLRTPIYAKLPETMHHFMYEDLYTFAGQYRKASDPNQGRIYFGKQHAQQRKPKFTGDHPDSIADGVTEAVLHLRKWARDPVYKAVRFYQKFVNIHPFYDGNGRIARLIANTYLYGHGLTISWSDFDSKINFLRKLNRCHLNPNEETFQILTEHIRKFTISFKDLES